MQINNDSPAPALPHELAQQIEAARNNLTLIEQESIRLTNLNRMIEVSVSENLKKNDTAKAELKEIEDKIQKGRKELTTILSQKTSDLADAEKARSDRDEALKIITSTKIQADEIRREITKSKDDFEVLKRDIEKREETVTIREDNADLVAQEAVKFATTIQTICKYSKE